MRILEKIFSKPGKMKFGNVHLLGVLLGALYRYHPAFVVRVIENVIESICMGLEQNDFRFYQRRIAEVKYLSELYNYRMLEHPVIFDTMYKILTFGHGKPTVLQLQDLLLTFNRRGSHAWTFQPIRCTGRLLPHPSDHDYVGNLRHVLQPGHRWQEA